MNRSTRGASERTSRDAELDLTLADVARGQRGRALADVVRSAVVTGSLEPGAPLPSTRRLAADLGVSRGLVVDAYAQLVAEGHLVAVPGSGTRVGERAAPAPPSPRIVVEQVAGHNPGQPDPAMFPRREWLRSSARATAALPDAAFAYGDMRGAIELRTALASYLGRVRSIATTVDQVLIVNGFAQTLACVAQLLSRAEGASPAVIACEDPGSKGAVDQLTWWGLDVVRVPVDHEGIDVSALERSKASAVVVTPAHQYPTGVTLSAARRHALVEWAARTGGLIVEDDYDAEYRYDREPLTSLHALAPESVLAAGSVSKSMSPSLRLGWIVAPRGLVAQLAEIKGNMDLGSAALTQAALADFIETGALDRHLRRTRTRYRRRRDALVDALRTHAPSVEISGISAGLHVALMLPPSVDEDRVVSIAREAGFAAQPLHRYRHRPGPPGVVLGYASMTPPRIAEAVEFVAPSLVAPSLVAPSLVRPGAPT